MQVLISPITPMIMIGIGIFLIGLEVLLSSFFIIWFGIGFLLIGAWHYVFPFTEGAYQLASVAILSMILLFLFKEKARKMLFRQSELIKDDYLNEAGYGEVVEGMISFKGTLWKYEPKIELKEGQRVKVLEAKNNRVKIELINE